MLILGSTGSIGTQALEVIEANPDRFRCVGLAAGGANPTLLAKQAADFDVESIAVSNLTSGADLRAALAASGTNPNVLSAPDSVLELIDAVQADIVLNAIPGSRGLEPTLRTLATGATLALANKESLIAGGSLVLKAAKPGQIVPVDSEHSALAQCLRGGRSEEVAKLVLTASGGPFRGRRREELTGVTVAEAMAHPTWAMGPLVTINSATLVNKGLEVIEAHLLFDVPYEQIAVVVHPQSIVHSMVTFTDGSTLAQASPPDMRLPISLALSWPDRVPQAASACDFAAASAWTFEPLDHETFPAVQLAKQAGTAGGCLPAVYNAANEEAVSAFLAGMSGFTRIVDTVRQVLDEASAWRSEPLDVAEVLAAENWARARAREFITAEPQKD